MYELIYSALSPTLTLVKRRDVRAKQTTTARTRAARGGNSTRTSIARVFGAISCVGCLGSTAPLSNSLSLGSSDTSTASKTSDRSQITIGRPTLPPSFLRSWPLINHSHSPELNPPELPSSNAHPQSTTGTNSNSTQTTTLQPINSNKIDTMSSSVILRGGTGIPPGSSGGRSVGSTRPAASALSCNLCSKPLATTCFLCACDCIFCEGEWLLALECCCLALIG